MTTGGEAFREEVRDFLHRQLPPGWRGLGALDHDAARRFITRWRASLAEAKLLGVSWPEEYGGRGLGEMEQVLLVEEMVKAGVPDGAPHDRFGIKMLGNTLLRWGSEQQKASFLPRILSGEDRWCQGFSEPASGSDLASLSCKAELIGEEWHVTGQKVWTSLAQEANWIFLLVRTDPSAPKHRGITFMMCPMGQSGIDVRPIRALSGQSDFCEVFLTDVRVRPEWIVGALHGGWAVANTLLGFERGEAAATFPLRFREEFDRLVELARARGSVGTPSVRDRLVRAYCEVEAMRFLGLRTLSSYSAGAAPGPEASVTKLYWSEYHQRVTDLAVDILGPEAMAPSGRWPSNMIRTDDPGAPPDSASWVGTFLNSRAGTIYAGTSEIQRNLLAEGVLGLPREAR